MLLLFVLLYGKIKVALNIIKLDWISGERLRCLDGRYPYHVLVWFVHYI